MFGIILRVAFVICSSSSCPDKWCNGIFSPQRINVLQTILFGRSVRSCFIIFLKFCSSRGNLAKSDDLKIFCIKVIGRGLFLGNVVINSGQ